MRIIKEKTLLLTHLIFSFQYIISQKKKRVHFVTSKSLMDKYTNSLNRVPSAIDNRTKDEQNMASTSSKFGALLDLIII